MNTYVVHLAARHLCCHRTVVYFPMVHYMSLVVFPALVHWSTVVVYSRMVWRAQPDLHRHGFADCRVGKYDLIFRIIQRSLHAFVCTQTCEGVKRCGSDSLSEKLA